LSAIASVKIIAMLALLKRFLTWLGGVLPQSMVWKLHMAGKHVHAGRWMKDHNFSCDVRVRHREQVIEAMARPITDKQVLYLEFGVFPGNSIRQWAGLLTNRTSRLHGFDSFEGWRETWSGWSWSGWSWSGWSKKGQQTMETKGSVMPNIPDERVKFFKGWIEDTLETYKMEENEVLVIFNDTGVYSSTSFVLKRLRDYFKVGTIIYFDQFAIVEHELQAFDDFLLESGMKFELIAADYGLMNVAFRRVG
jgi:Macrocin-O-methyltransferase (TylF)